MKARLAIAALGCPLLAQFATAEELDRVATTVRSTDPTAEVQQRGKTSELVLFGTDGLQTGTSTEWQAVCRVPCDRPLDPHGTFRIAGPNITPSSPFTIPSSSSAVAIDVRAGSLASRAGGLVAGALGLGSMLVGTGLLVAASHAEPPTSGPFAGPAFAQINAESAREASGLRTGGYAALALGTVSLIVGLVLFANSGTSVAVSAN